MANLNIELVIPKAAFKRLVPEILTNIVKNNDNISCTEQAYEEIETCIQGYIISLFQAAQSCARRSNINSTLFALKQTKNKSCGSARGNSNLGFGYDTNNNNNCRRTNKRNASKLNGEQSNE